MKHRAEKRDNDADQPADGTRPPAAMCTMTLRIAPAHIVLFKSIVESYDNLATLRTEDPRNHHLKLYFAPESAADVEALIESLAPEFAIERIADGGCGDT